MTNQPNRNSSNLPESSENNNGRGDAENPEQYRPISTATTNQIEQYRAELSRFQAINQQGQPKRRSISRITLVALGVMAIGLVLNNPWVGVSGAIVAILISLPTIWEALYREFVEALSSEQRSQLVAAVAMFLAIAGLLNFFDFYRNLAILGKSIQWEAFGTLAEWTGALGQILIAVLAVYIAWRQYIISKDLTIEQNRLTRQQNVLTQQQTIDAYFQGVSDLALDDQGLLEDWPQERAFAEGRTAALLSSVDAAGKAKILRFLSQSKLLTPLKRDRHLGRPIFDGQGGYEEDRSEGVRVIDLNVMLAGADLAGADLRWTDLSDANLVNANLRNADLVKANLSRAILYEADLSGADLRGALLFYGSVETATPRSRMERPNYETGAHTGAVVENTDFTGVKRLSDAQRQYCCAWCGEKSRATIPGGCEGIPNLLGR